MSAVTEASPKALAPRPRGGVVQSVRDSLVVAKRNPIRMLRIPNLLRRASIRFNWSASAVHVRWVSAETERSHEHGG
ncbi:hypothetical protein SSPS47_22115 [Streptomyces sp. S4.7]|nr:hypothetical protein SSPS47_22115 [Streptomyces sp. S4.7]